jgi:flavin reductase (DIM6/NTAB) family NADH-FMN oxidoreductase RutF/rubredoxin
MINIEALFKVSYGLYIVCSGDDKNSNGFISNTVFQVTSDPPKFAAVCSKENYTAEFIQKYGCFSVSILHNESSADIFGRFGYRSGKDFDKLEGMDIRYGESGVPIVLNEAMAYLECRVVETFDVGTHQIFIGELIQSDIIDDSLYPITYLQYREIRKGVAPKNAPTFVDKSKFEIKIKSSTFAQYQCAACGYIYDEEIEEVKFDDLPDDWLCPICGSEKEDFFKL